MSLQSQYTTNGGLSLRWNVPRMQLSTCDLCAERLRRIVCRENATVFKSSRLAFAIAAANIQQTFYRLN